MDIRNYVRFGLPKGMFVQCMGLLTSGCGPEDANSGTVEANWIAPVERANGDPLSLSEIGGYRVYNGKTTENYPNQLDINDGTAEQAIFDVPSGAIFSL